MKPNRLLISALLGAAAFATWADGAETPRVDQRQAQQAQRIEQGQAAGALTAREARRLQRQQAAIGHAEGHAKADGSVNMQERRRLHQMQNHASGDIRRQKHDRQTDRQQGQPRAATEAGV
ncbi:MAG: hypothetical protein Q8N44_09750 [Rubrivivax sp.]|nr:hypothetical protein [Rubrivivax sp.]